jgi:ABC-type sugar transport system ATPase subunit
MNLVPGRLENSTAFAGSVTLPLPPQLQKAFATHAGHDVVLGMRPEDFHLQESSPRTAPIPIIAVATEILGPEVILVGNMGNSSGPEIMIRCAREFTAEPGQPIDFHYDVSQLQVFDKVSTAALPRRK